MMAHALWRWSCLAGLLLFAGLSTAERTLYALCHAEMIEVRVVLDEPGFYGLVHTRPNRNTCAVWATGDSHVTMYIPLTEPKMTECGVVKTNDFYTAVVDVRRHQALELIDDSSFLVQCSADRIALPNSIIPSQVMSLQVLKEEEVVNEVEVSEKYIVEISVPDVYHYQVSSCTAFTGADTIHFIPIIDANGCPVDSATITPFLPVANQHRLRSELVMFRFNESHQFFVQCSIAKCEQLCTQPVCTPRASVNLLSLHRVIQQNEMAILASTRLMVMDKWQTAKVVRVRACAVPENAHLVKLILTAALLGLFTVLSTGAAWRNRPFALRCDDDEGEDSTRTGSGTVKLPNYKMLPFSLALPPMTMTENNKGNLITTTLSTRGGRSSGHHRPQHDDRTDNSLDDNEVQHVHDDLDTVDADSNHNYRHNYVDMSVTTTAMTERSVLATMAKSDSHPTMIVRQTQQFTLKRHTDLDTECSSSRRSPGGGILVIRNANDAAESTLGRKRPTVRIRPEFINDNDDDSPSSTLRSTSHQPSRSYRVLDIVAEPEPAEPDDDQPEMDDDADNIGPTLNAVDAQLDNDELEDAETLPEHVHYDQLHSHRLQNAQAPPPPLINIDSLQTDDSMESAAFHTVFNSEEHAKRQQPPHPPPRYQPGRPRAPKPPPPPRNPHAKPVEQATTDPSTSAVATHANTWFFDV